MKENPSYRTSKLFKARCSAKKSDIAKEIISIFQYSDSSSDQIVSGRWTPQECKTFCQCKQSSYKVYPIMGNNWQMISTQISSRTPNQVRSHAQKYLSKLKRKQNQQRELEEAKRLIFLEENLRLTRKNKYNISQTKQDKNKNYYQSVYEIKNKRGFPNETVKEYPTGIYYKEENQQQIKERESEHSLTQRQMGVKSTHGNILNCIEVPQPNFGYPKKYENGHSLFLQSLLPFLLQGLPKPIFLFDNDNKNYSENKDFFCQQYEESNLIIQNQKMRKQQTKIQSDQKDQAFGSSKEKWQNQMQEQEQLRYDRKLRSPSQSLSLTASQKRQKQITEQIAYKPSQRFESLV